MQFEYSKEKIKNIILKALNLFLLKNSRIINKLLGFSNLIVLFRFHNAIGDIVCLTAIVEEIYKQKNKKCIVFSSYPELFYRNPNVVLNFNIRRFDNLFYKVLTKLKGNNILDFNFQNIEDMKMEEYLRKTKLKLSLIKIHSLHFNLDLNLNDSKPKIYFSKKELIQYKKKFNYLKNYAVIQPVGKISYTPNKEWGFMNYQDVVNSTKNIINWVQVGLKNDPLLFGVEDLRGHTNIRELIYIIKQSNFTLSNEGLINHLAASVNTMSFVIFSGFLPVEVAHYSTTLPIKRFPNVVCSPCWLLEECPRDKFCLKDITVKKVIERILKEINYV
jgi:hypothetical protein